MQTVQMSHPRRRIQAIPIGDRKRRWCQTRVWSTSGSRHTTSSGNPTAADLAPGGDSMPQG
jgi:hypothetical protein